MGQSKEVFVVDIVCTVCGYCKPWVLCVCYSCEKEWWRKATLACRWCDECLEKEVDVGKIVLITGHVELGSDEYWECCQNWAQLVS